MSQPTPKTPLGNHCSVLSGTTIYTVSENAFQSLSLTNGSDWQVLPPPISASGAVCVHAGKGTSNEALYLVGGSTTNETSIPDKGFFGLQQYKLGSGSSGSWTQITVIDAVTYNLTGHGATYMDNSGQLIVFAGTKYPTPAGTASANTYLLKIADGTATSTSLPPASAPLLSPIILPWASEGALVVGGNTGNTNLNLYTPTGGWQDLSKKLSSGLPTSGSAGAALIKGDDGSEMLMTFDFTQSPTAVGEDLVSTDGTAAKKLRRDGSLTASNWPSYNSTGAPTGSRINTAVASDGDNIVFTSDDKESPVLMFNARKNSWEDVQQILRNDNTDFNIESTSSTTSSSATSSATSSSTSKPSGSSTMSATATGASATAATMASGAATMASGAATVASGAASTTSAAASKGTAAGGLNTVQLLFVVLGSILAAAILLACILIFLRRRQLDQKKTTGAGNKNHLSFQDRGASFMKEAGGTLSPSGSSGLFPPPPRPAFANAGNTDSWGHVQAVSAGNPNYASSMDTNSMDYLKDGPVVHAIGGQGVISTRGGAITAPPNDRFAEVSQERSSGWSKYFSGNQSAQNLVGGHTRGYSNAGHQSEYTDVSSFPTQALHPNPNLYNAGPGVAAGGIGAALEERRNSELSLSSAGRDSYSSGIPESIKSEKQVWSPVEETVSLRDGPRRGPVASSVYPESPRTASNRDTVPATDTHSGVDNLSWLNLKQH